MLEWSGTLANVDVKMNLISRILDRNITNSSKDMNIRQYRSRGEAAPENSSVRRLVAENLAQNTRQSVTPWNGNQSTDLCNLYTQENLIDYACRRGAVNVVAQLRSPLQTWYHWIPYKCWSIFTLTNRRQPFSVVEKIIGGSRKALVRYPGYEPRTVGKREFPY